MHRVALWDYIGQLPASLLDVKCLYSYPTHLQIVVHAWTRLQRNWGITRTCQYWGPNHSYHQRTDEGQRNKHQDEHRWALCALLVAINHLQLAQLSILSWIEPRPTGVDTKIIPTRPWLVCCYASTIRHFVHKFLLGHGVYKYLPWFLYFASSTGSIKGKNAGCC